MSETEKSARIVEMILAPTYSHAERIFQLFEEYAKEEGVSAAIDRIYEEVVEPVVEGGNG